jgi:hypothetical protein
MSHGGDPLSAIRVQPSDRQTPLTGSWLPPVADLPVLAWNPTLLMYIWKWSPVQGLFQTQTRDSGLQVGGSGCCPSYLEAQAVAQAITVPEHCDVNLQL